MPQVEVTIGGRAFTVACQSGEEPYLTAAAKLLDEEASGLASQAGRMPESKMLLMAGLMLADRAAGLEDRLRQAEVPVHLVDEPGLVHGYLRARHMSNRARESWSSTSLNGGK